MGGPGTSVLIDHCVFTENTSFDIGGNAVYADAGVELIVTASTFLNNGLYNDISLIAGQNLAITRCIFAGDDEPWTSASAAISCTNVQSGWTYVPHFEGVDGNFSADPLFCAPEQGDFTLSSQSPCLPGNHPDGVDCGVIGALGEGCGPASIDAESWAGIKSRYRSSTTEGGR